MLLHVGQEQWQVVEPAVEFFLFREGGIVVLPDCFRLPKLKCSRCTPDARGNLIPVWSELECTLFMPERSGYFLGQVLFLGGSSRGKVIKATYHVGYGYFTLETDRERETEVGAIWEYDAYAVYIEPRKP